VNIHDSTGRTSRLPAGYNIYNTGLEG
jgi:hypothetical protein